ncbi:MAG: DUF1844 domain-containing protein [Armatimonadota bacterium]|nr:DUF1844 domain-containing protein [Armatimonadota bacterium]
MAEEEQGFTFVDKRGTQTETATVASETASPAEATSTPEAYADDQGFDDEAEDDDGAAPDVYSLIGYCVSLLSAQAWQCLGLLADPQTGQAQADLAQAKVAIDAVSDLAARLEAAPQAVVPENMRRELRTLVNDLRLNFVSRQNQPSS